MKSKQIAIALIALSLLAVAFASTVVAATTYYPTMSGVKSGKHLTFTIDTTGLFSGLDVNPSSIVLTVYDAKNNLLPSIPVDSSAVTLYADSIVIQMVKQDGFPAHASAIHATGAIGTGGDTFYASGPGWAWGGIR